MEIYGFVGPSGTGKSYRAQLVAGEYNISYIIDDGLFIKENAVIAGSSAKKAPTKIETIRHALFTTEEEQNEIKKAVKKYKPQSILILGTSDGMVKKIAENLGLPEIKKIIYIQEYATPEDMANARRIRETEGKHVIPVPTFEIKKDFAGFILDPLQIFKSKGEGAQPYMAEKSIIRPTFSYLGNFTISDTVFRQILEYLSKKSTTICKVEKVRAHNNGNGVTIYMEVIVKYGCNIVEEINKFKAKARKEIEKLTTMPVISIKVIAKGISIE